MATKFPKLSITYLARRGFATKTEAKLKHSPKGSELKQVKLPNGLIVVAVEDQSPVSRIGVFVRAGSRYETAENLGITHCLRNAAGLSTLKSTVFGITRNVEHHGGSLTATTTRDDIIYQLTSTRDKITDNSRYLADTVTRPAFKPWEIKDFAYRMKVENERLENLHGVVLFEALHKACFRGGLSNSLYAPDYMVSAFDHNMLMHYFNDNYLTSRMAVVGQGVDHDSLLEYVEKSFTMRSGDGGVPVKSKFVGSEVRLEKNLDVCSAAVVTEGASATNLKDMITLSLFQHLLGTGPHLTHSTGGSKLNQALTKVAEDEFVVSSLNVSYNETGIFGFVVAGSPKEMHKLIKCAVTKMREVAKNLKEDDLKLAKRILKANMLISTESKDSHLEEIGTQALNLGKVYEQNELEAMIDSIKLHDFGSLATKVMKGRGAMASIGQLQNVPYLEDLA